MHLSLRPSVTKHIHDDSAIPRRIPAKPSEGQISERIEAVISSDNVQDAVLAAVALVPVVGGSIATWIGQKMQREAYARVFAMLQELSAKVERLHGDGITLQLDEEFAELVTSLMPIVARTRNEQKRHRYAALLANAATRHTAEERDEALVMAQVLDQLEYRHVALLDYLMRLPASQEFHGLWRGNRTIEVSLSDFDDYEGVLLLHMQALGLLELNSFRQSTDPVRGAGELRINARGLQFHRWITEAGPSERNA